MNLENFKQAYLQTISESSEDSDLKDYIRSIVEEIIKENHEELFQEEAPKGYDPKSIYWLNVKSYCEALVDTLSNPYITDDGKEINLSNWTSETDCTEVIGGTSGRGSSVFRGSIRAMADRKYLDRMIKGKNTYYKITDKAKELAEVEPRITS